MQQDRIGVNESRIGVNWSGNGSELEWQWKLKGVRVDFDCAGTRMGILCLASVADTTNRQSHSRHHYPGGEHRENQRIKASGGYRFRVVPWRNKLSGFPQRLFCIMEKNQEIEMEVEILPEHVEWVESYAAANNTTPEKVVIAAITAAKQRQESGGAR